MDRIGINQRQRQRQRQSRSSSYQGRDLYTGEMIARLPVIETFVE